MRRFFHNLFVTIFIISLGISQLYGESKTIEFCGGYPVINILDLESAPKNIPVEEVDVNSDGLIDLIAIYPWGGSALYINGGYGQYYRVIRSNNRIKVQSFDKGGWATLSLNPTYNVEGNDPTTLIDGQLYRFGFLPFTSEDDNEIDCNIKHNGKNYILPFDECKALGIRAPRYRFDQSVHINEKSGIQEVEMICLELTNKSLKILNEYQDFWTFHTVYFTDLNLDGLLDAVLRYEDIHGSGAQAYSALLLNNGDNSFVFSGEIRLGRIGLSFPKLQSQEIIVDGRQFIALVYKEPIFIRPGEENIDPKQKFKNYYDLFIYQPILKKFIHLTALPGKDKSTFVPLDQKKFENIVDPLIFRTDPSKLTKLEEDAIITLIGNYKKSIIMAINSNQFSIVEKYLVFGSDLYYSQKDLVAKLYAKRIQEKLIDFKVEAIKTSSKANGYEVYVSEKVGVKHPGKTDFTVSEYHWVYTVVLSRGKYTLSDIAKWDRE